MFLKDEGDGGVKMNHLKQIGYREQLKNDLAWPGQSPPQQKLNAWGRGCLPSVQSQSVKMVFLSLLGTEVRKDFY